MGSIGKIGWALINRNRMLSFFMGFIFMICLAGLIAAMSIMTTTSGIFEKHTMEQKSAHIIRIMNSNNADIEAMKNYLDQDERIESYHLQFSTDSLNRVQINDYDDIMAIIQELPVESRHDKIQVIDGEVNKSPGLNEVWIPSGVAYKYKISVGDRIKLRGVDGQEDYEISAIVYDPLYASPMLQPSRMWVRSGQLSMLKGIGESNYRTLSIRLNELDQMKSVLVDFDAQFPAMSYTLNMDYYTFKSMSNVLNDIISGVLLGTSILLTCISAAIIFFIVSGEIINDYTVFGIYKGLGFSTRQIKNINKIKYMLLVLMVMPFSLLGAFGISRIVLSIYENMAGLNYLTPNLLVPTLFSILIMTLIIAVTIQVASLKLNRLNPAEAIRFGYVSNKKYKRVTKPSKLSPVFSLALKEVKINPLRSGVKILTITGLATLIFIVNIMSGSLGGIFTTELTMGISEGDIFVQKNETITGRSGKKILDDLKTVEGIKKIIPAIISFNNGVKSEGEYIGLMGFGYEDYSNIGRLNIIEGRNPSNNSEVAITKTLSKKINKSIGDMITLNIEGHNKTFLITGNFQIMSNMGLAFRITTEAYQMANAEADYNWYSVITDSNTEDLVALKAKLVERFGNELTISIFEEFIEDIVGNISGSIRILSYVLIVIMVFICGLALYNMIWLQMLENKKHYGLLKSIGMSSIQLIEIQLIKMTILTTVGVFLGFMINARYAPNILTSMLASTGIDHVDAIQSPIWILIATVFIFIVTLLSTYVAAFHQSKINLKRLIME